MQEISFDVSREAFDIIIKLAERVESLERKHGHRPQDRMSTVMDFVACHANGCPLKLVDMLEASDVDFAHDAFGIRRHIDRSTGELTDCFLPRYAA